MTTEEKKDFRLAIIVLLVVFFIGLAVGKCWACEDYNSCINRAKQFKWCPLIAKTYSDQALAYATGDIAETLKKLVRS